jgi:hypothetical protein
MLTLDIFNNDAFGTVELTEALELVPYKPQYLGSLNIFEQRPVTTETIAIEQREGTLALVQTTPRGAPLPQRGKDPRTLHDFRTVRVAKGDRIMASEIQNVRDFGTTTALEQIQDQVMRRMTGVRNDVELTWENMRLGAIQGIVLDADGSTIRNYFTEFGIAQPGVIDFDLDNANPASGAVRVKCNQVVRATMRAAKGMWLPQTQVFGLAADDFFDALVAHSEVRQTYLNQQEASQLRNDVGNAFDQVRYGQITFVNYRGTDDGTTLTVPAGTCKFFPVGAPGAFVQAMSPGESMTWANTQGRPFYPMIVPDRDRDQWADVEIYSYPLFIAARPGMLQRATLT